jgi:uncharacterized Fe-S cluster-containing radical SAM superfamily protein
MKADMTAEISNSKFGTVREGGNSWAQSKKLVQAFKEGAFWDVPPLTMEFAPILDCNANCPLCPFKRSRNAAQLPLVAAGHFPAADDRTVTTLDTAKKVLEKAAEAGVRAVLWTGGGEPSIWRPILEAVRYSATLGMLNCLYTNGLRLGHDSNFVEELLAPDTNMVFVRVSVNTVSEEATPLHWGIGLDELRAQFMGLEHLFSVREKRWASLADDGARVPSIQVSTIIDKNNAIDALGICQEVARIAGKYPACRGHEDVMVVRPLTIHGRTAYSLHDHDEQVVQQIISVCGQNGDGRKLVESANFRLFQGFGLDRVESGTVQSYSEVVEAEYRQRDVCWSNGVFLTVGPGGIVYLSTSHNCDRDPKWALGDLRTQSVAEVYQGKRRREIVEYANNLRWGPQVEQPTARTNRLDRIARAMMTGELNDGEIEAIRMASLQSHNLLLD